MSPLAVMFVLVLVSVAVTVATSLPLLGSLLGRAHARREQPRR